MRSVSLSAPAAAFAALLCMATAGGCSSGPRPGAGPRVAMFSYTCCRASDINRIYSPGQTVSIHWIVTSAAGTSKHESPNPVTLSAKLSGAFSSGSAAKAAIDGTATVSARAIKTSEDVGGAPISYVTLPNDAQPGDYNLTTTVDDGGGIVSSGSIIRVSTDH